MWRFIFLLLKFEIKLPFEGTFPSGEGEGISRERELNFPQHFESTRERNKIYLLNIKKAWIDDARVERMFWKLYKISPATILGVT